VTALNFMTAIDDPYRFRRSRDVAAYLGPTTRRWQSGTSIDVQGRISKAGDADVRRALYEAAAGLLTRFKGTDKVKT
jgi:transposase